MTAVTRDMMSPVRLERTATRGAHTEGGFGVSRAGCGRAHEWRQARISFDKEALGRTGSIGRDFGIPSILPLIPPTTTARMIMDIQIQSSTAGIRNVTCTP